MLPHPAHPTGVTQNCTSFLNSPNKLVGFGTFNKETDPIRPNASLLDRAIDFVKGNLKDD
jgi:hypothetical protein